MGIRQNLAFYINFVFQRSIASVITLTSPPPPPASPSVEATLSFLPSDWSIKGRSARQEVEDERDMGHKESGECLSLGPTVSGLWKEIGNILYFIDSPLLTVMSLCDERNAKV